MPNKTPNPSHHPRPEPKEPRGSRADKAGAPGDSFYKSVLNAEGKERLDEARSVKGLDDEIAILRWRIRYIVQKDVKHRKNPQLLKAMELIIRAYTAKARASGDPSAPTEEGIENMLRGASEKFGLKIIPWESNC